jgi:hypothetical protein
MNEHLRFAGGKGENTFPASPIVKAPWKTGLLQSPQFPISRWLLQLALIFFATGLWANASFSIYNSTNCNANVTYAKYGGGTGNKTAYANSTLAVDDAAFNIYVNISTQSGSTYTFFVGSSGSYTLTQGCSTGGGGGGGSNNCTVAFTNTGCQTAELFWNNNGSLVSYGTVAANATKNQGTVNGHVWVMKVGSTTVGNHTVNCSSPSYSFNSGGCGGGGGGGGGGCNYSFTINNTGCNTVTVTGTQTGSIAGGASQTFTGTGAATFNWSYPGGSGNGAVNCSTGNATVESGGCGGGGGGSTNCSVAFTNTGCQTAELFWNNNGTLVSYGTVAANATKNQNSYNGHVWVIKVGSTTVGNHTVNCSSPSYSFNSGGCGGGNGGGGCNYSFTINNTGCNTVTVTGTQTGSIAGGASQTFTGTGAATFNWTYPGGSGNGAVDCSTGNATVNSGGCGGGGGSNNCSVAFTNTGCQTAELFWNNNGTLVSYGTVAANATKNQNSYNGHVWVIKVGSTTVGNHTVNCSSPSYSFNSGGCGGGNGGGGGCVPGTQRTVTNTNDNCGGWCGGQYVLNFGPGQCYMANNDLVFKEFNDGTATLTGSVYKGTTTLNVNITFTGKTSNSSPYYDLCINSGGASWYYYTNFSGTIGSYNIAKYGAAFQVGNGANLQENAFGASGWFTYNGTVHGDFNFRLSAATNLPTTNVATNISGNLSICSGQTTTLTASGGSSYQWSNGSSGSSITVGAGTYTVTATNASGCTGVSTVTVSQTNSTVNLTNCPANISQSVSAGSSCKVVNWTAPSATSNCGTPTLSSNFAPGYCFPIGTTTVVYTATLNGVTQTCSFTVTITSNDPCANLGGDSDGDGTCNNNDCQPNNPAFPAIPGLPCNDGNPNTTNDVVTANGCGCAGTPVNNCTISAVVSDIVCNDNGTPNNAGDDTYTFKITATKNGSCGTYWSGGGKTGNYGTAVNFGPYPISGGDKTITVCDAQVTTACATVTATKPSTCSSGGGGGTPDCVNGISITTNNGNIVVTGLNGAPVSSLQVLSATWQPVYSCFANCGASQTVPVPTGTYYVYAKYYTAGYSLICEKQATITVTGGDPCANQAGDTDGDGVCNNQDCQPNNPAFPATPGTACNDGNPNTTNDVVTANGCGCAGTVQNPCANQGGDTDGDGVCNNQDCQPNNPAFPATPGTACNDGNPNTTNDVVTANGCGCAGTPVNNCTISAVVSDILCNNNGTPNNAGDDTYTFKITVAKNGSCGTYWSGGGKTGSYGTAVMFGPYPISGGNQTITVCDAQVTTACATVTATKPNTCSGGGGTPDCVNGISITTGNGSIIVSGLSGAPISALQVFTASWQQVFSCFANCNGTETINVPAGTYMVYAKYYTAGYSLICEKQATVTVGGGGGGGTCENVTNAGTIGFGTSCTGSTTFCPNQGAAPLVKNCVTPSGGAGNLEIVWLKSTTSCTYPTTTAAEIAAGLDPHWTMIPGATSLDYNPGSPTQQTCYLRCARRAGCSVFVESNIVTLGISSNCGGGSGGGTPNCANVGITTGPGSISVTGLNGAPVTSVQIFSATWQPEHNCFANCQSPTATFSVTAGAHYVYVKYYTASYQLICEVNQTVNVAQALAGSQSESFQFDAIKHPEHVQLLWKHNGDYMVDEYVLERSLNGTDFEDVYATASDKSTAADIYEAYDLEPQTGVNYYRLRMLNEDGTERLSEVKQVVYEDIVDFGLFPNPANGFTNLNLEKVVGKQDVDIHIYNNMGLRMKQYHLDEVWGKYYQMDLRDLHEGHYSVWVNVPGKRPVAVKLVIGRL